MAKKLKLIWQTLNSPLRDWILEVFSPLLEGEIADGEHKIVLDNCLVVDTNVHLADPGYYPRFRGRNAFLFREPDEYFWDFRSGIYVNFCGVFRSQSSGAFMPNRVFQIPVGYNRGLGGASEVKAASERKFAWAMMGQLNKSTRPDCVRALLSVKPNFWYASDKWTPVANQTANSVTENQPKAAYKELLGEAAFCPAPMGNVHQETTRPYEALEAGSIPLLERSWRMDAHRRVLGNHPLPAFSNWKAAAGFVESIWKDRRALDELQAECLTWWQAYKSNLTTEAGAFVDRLWMDFPQSNSEFVRSYARLPAWSAFELLRHHNLNAFGRRIARQTRRLIEQKRFFERI